MPSAKAMRVWAIGSIVFLWGTLGWGIADQFFWSPQGTPLEVVHQLARQVQLLAYGVMAAAGLRKWRYRRCW
jgi:hypothetical protein